MIERTLRYNELRLDESEIYEALGYEQEMLPDERIRQEVSLLLQEIEPNLEARLGIITTGIDTLQQFNPGKIILSQLKGSQALCYFVATAGQWYEDFQQWLMQQGDMLRVYIANEIGTLLAEKTADCMEETLEEQITPKSLHHTNRFSPGYCGWDVKEQKMLFSLFAANGNNTMDITPCGIHLTDSCLMIPIKSVSGVIGIGRDVKKHDYKCERCGLESCYKRRKRN